MLTFVYDKIATTAKCYERSIAGNNLPKRTWMLTDQEKSKTVIINGKVSKNYKVITPQASIVPCEKTAKLVSLVKVLNATK